MAVTFFPFNSIVVDGVPDRPANAENLAAYLAGFFSNGVVMQNDTALQVEASSGMNVQIHAGMGNINGKTIINDAAEIVTLAVANVSLARIDRVVFRLDEANRLMEFDVLTGTPATSPTAPALTQSADVYELCLAEIRVPAGTTSIEASHITDTRLNAALCGEASIAPHMQPIKHGGTGASTTEEALANLGLTVEEHRGSQAANSGFATGNNDIFGSWTYTARYIPAFKIMYFVGYGYTKTALDANENYVAFTLNNLAKLPASSTVLAMYNGGNACGDAIARSTREIQIKFPAVKSAKIGIFITGFWFVA